jgi:site-specific recombinase XerD
MPAASAFWRDLESRFQELLEIPESARLTAMGLHLDQIKTEHIAGFVAHRQGVKVQVSTINRDLATLRRAFPLRRNGGRFRRSFRACGCFPAKITGNGS